MAHEEYQGKRILYGAIVPEADLLVEGGAHYVAALEGGVFRAKKLVYVYSGHGGVRYGVSDGYTIYTPIHSSQALKDIEGATFAHDDGTHWHFSHASPKQHHDFEAVCEALWISHIQPNINKTTLKSLETTNKVTRAGQIDKLDSLNKFSVAVQAEIEKRVRAETLGHFHRNQHEDNQRDLVVASIKAVLLAWKAEALTSTDVRDDRANVIEEANAIVTAMTTTPTIEHRAARVARLAAEEAKKKAAETPAEGGSQPAQEEGSGE